MEVRRIWIPSLLIGAFFVLWIFPGIAGADDKDFSDVPSSYGYSDAIHYLKNNGIVAGYPDGTYRPGQTLSRAEFMLMVLKAKGQSISKKTNCFSDVKNEWFAKYVCTAKEHGFIKGYGDGLFHPEKVINFAEAATIITNVFDLKKDAELSGKWYQSSVVALEQAHAIPMSIIRFDNFMHRGSFAEMLWRVMTHTINKSTMTYGAIQNSEDAFNKLLADSKISRKKTRMSDYILVGSTPFVPFTHIKINLLPEFDLINQMAAQGVIEENNVSFDPEKLTNGLPDGVTEQMTKEIKVMALVWNQMYVSEMPKDVMDYNKFIFLGVYRNIVYITMPHSGKYYFYPALDAKTARLVTNWYYTSGEVRLEDFTFFMDKNGIHPVNKTNFELGEVQNADMLSLEFVANNSGTDWQGNREPVLIFKDKNHVYSFVNNQLYVADSTIDIASFTHYRLDGEVGPEELYFTDKNSVYFIDNAFTDPSRAFLKIPDSDPATFNQITYDYFKDKNHVYMGFRTIEGADPNTFEFQQTFGSGKIMKDAHSLFVVDKYTNSAFPRDVLPLFKKAPDFDLANAKQFFIETGWERMPQIPTNIFFYNNKVYSYALDIPLLVEIVGADPNTLTFAGNENSTIFTDANSVYILRPDSFILTRVENADRATFATLREPLYKDKNHLYLVTATSPFVAALPDTVDVNTFEVLTSTYAEIVPITYAKDKNHVYLLKDGILQTIDNLDAATFKFRHYGGMSLANDKNAVYYLKNQFIPIKNLDSKTFEFYSGWTTAQDYYYYLYDEKGVWYYSTHTNKLRRIYGADPKTFDFTKLPDDQGTSLNESGKLLEKVVPAPMATPLYNIK